MSGNATTGTPDDQRKGYFRETALAFTSHGTNKTEPERLSMLLLELPNGTKDSLFSQNLDGTVGKEDGGDGRKDAGHGTCARCADR